LLEDQIFEYFVIGSGLTGVIAVNELNGTNFKFCYGNNSKLKKEIFENKQPNFNLPKAMKTSKGRELNYYIPPDLDFNNVKKVTPLHTLSKNGFSEVWGAAIMPPSKYTLKLWKFKYKIELNQIISDIFKILPKSNFTEDSLNLLYDMPIDLNVSNNLSQYHVGKLTTCNYFFFGKTRLSVYSNYDKLNESRNCVHCLQCLSGCNYGSILKSDQLFTYDTGKFVISNFNVQKLIENENYVEILGEIDNNSIIYKAKRVLLAAGTVGSAKIVLNSKILNISKIAIRDTQTKYELFLQFFNNTQKNKISLSEFTCVTTNANLEIKVLTQLYFINQNLIDENLNFLNKFFLLRIFIPLLKKFFIIGITFISPESSNSIEIYRDEKSLSARVLHNRKKLRNESFYFLKRNLNLLKLKIIKIPLLGITTKPGSGVHSGSWFNPENNEKLLDNLGRLHDDSRVHVIDSSALPELPIGPISLAAMANSRRITVEVTELN
jgi:hypothetical protein